MTNQQNPQSLDALASGRTSSDPFITLFSERNPTADDVNYPIQKRWFNTLIENEWILTSFTSFNGRLQANWQSVSFTSTGVDTLTGNTGGPVGVDINNNINVEGDGTTITISGNPGTNTLTASTTGAVATTYSTDLGTATPSLGVLNILGGPGINTSGSSDTVSVNLTTPVTISNGGTNATSMSTSNGIVKYDGTSLVTSTTATIDASNRMRNTAQPAFLAYLASNVNNVTGNGTDYQVGSTQALTEVFDQGGNFNTNGTFTAPVTGRYLFSAGAVVTGNTTATSMNIKIVTTNRSYYAQDTHPSSSDQLQATLTCLADMTANDTAVVTVAAFGEAGNTSDLVGSAVLTTFFSGYLAC